MINNNPTSNDIQNVNWEDIILSDKEHNQLLGILNKNTKLNNKIYNKKTHTLDIKALQKWLNQQEETNITIPQENKKYIKEDGIIARKTFNMIRKYLKQPVRLSSTEMASDN